MRRQVAVAIAAGSAALVTLAVLPQIALGKKKPSKVEVTTLQEPLGLQGRLGAGDNVPIVFTLTDRKARKTDVEVEFGIDRNADGVITDNEFRRASEDRLDPRDTRDDKKPFLFRSGKFGTPNSFVWRSFADVGIDSIRTVEFALTPNGRQIPDPENPGSFLFVPGPDGSSLLPGVKIRLRTVRGGRRGTPIISGSFSLVNDRAPSMTLDSFEPGSPLLVHWTAFDPDSEDANGNGVLDVPDGEDANANGILDDERIGVAFDYARLAEGVNPALLRDEELSTLVWSPCSRALEVVGNNDALDARPGIPVPRTGALSGVASAPPDVGRHWVFAWDAEKDVGVTADGFLIRGRPFDEHRSVGDFVYARTIVRVDL